MWPGCWRYGVRAAAASLTAAAAASTVVVRCADDEPTYPLAFVTGAGGTLGGAAVRALVEDGYRVIAADLTESHMTTLRDELNLQYGENCVVAVALDVSNSEQCEQVAAQVREDWGTVSVLVNNAGILSRAKLEATTPEEWFLGGMKDQQWGRIIMTGSMAAKTGGVTAGTAYSVSKGAVHALTLSVARECAAHGVTVNAIAPAYVRTPMITEHHTASQIQEIVDKIPVGRMCEPEEFGHVVRFLVSPLAGFITGEIIDQNGGMHMD